MTRAIFVSTLNRVFCGIAFVLHGIPKVSNFEATAARFQVDLGVPAWTAVPVGLLELFGGIALLVGLLSRPLAVAFVGLMAGAAVFVHLPNGWDVFAHGYEYDIARIILLIGVIVIGPGPLSLDALMRRRNSRAAMDSGPFS